jgi:plasmid maintenance system antidote protein VapI
MDAATEALRVQAEKIQRLVATGIGGAASASIDMILNAFSMSPVFGTTILVWRMFQNMLMIMGASLSVQAASNSTATTLATIANPKLAGEPPTPSKGGGAKAKAKNNVTKRLKTDIRQLNRSLKRYMHFPHKGMKGITITMSGSGVGSGYSYT